MNYDEITKITTERIEDYISEAIKTDCDCTPPCLARLPTS